MLLFASCLQAMISLVQKVPLDFETSEMKVLQIKSYLKELYLMFEQSNLVFKEIILLFSQVQKYLPLTSNNMPALI
jgi:hypothetical protein